jgi:very-short-patch-repair endonuclease
MADDLEAGDRTLRHRDGRDLSLQRESGLGSHRVWVLGVRSEVSISGSRDERIARVAGLQRGRIAVRQLRAVAVAPASEAWLVARGRLLPCLRGVFCVGHDAPAELGAETAGLLSVRDGAALSHWSAAALLGLWTPAPTVVEVTVDDAPAAANSGVRVHRSRILQSRDVQITRGLPVTSPARTLLDLALSATARQLEIAFDRAIVEKTLRPSQVTDILARAGGHRGRARLAALLDRESGALTMTQSQVEEAMLALIRHAGLPVPHVNFPFEGWKLDFYWPAARFAVEVDSYTYHGSRYRFERDRRKDNALRRADIEVLRIITRDITERSYGLVADITRELTRRGGL